MKTIERISLLAAIMMLPAASRVYASDHAGSQPDESLSGPSSTSAADPPGRIPILDELGREIIPGGFVLITEDRKGSIDYTRDDYRRMVRMGANFQVIRVTLGRLGGWPGVKADHVYLGRLDSMVRMGAGAGLKTIFKLVVYDVRPFGPSQWQALWTNTNDAQDTLLAAWKKLWVRYRDEPSVFGYDLLNEPQRGTDLDGPSCSRRQLLPLLRRLADAVHAVSGDKWALYQPLYIKNGGGEGPFEPMIEPFGRDRIIYAPHLYSMNRPWMIKMLDRYRREAALSRAPLMIGEWGPATDLAADNDSKKQARYTAIYQATANSIDRRRIGAIKAWFCGSRSPLTTATRPLFTWAIFSDKAAVGHIERKYITDAIARPRPLVVAGRVLDFGYDFSSRAFHITVATNPELTDTMLFVPADRFYPDGFRLDIGPNLTMTLEPDCGDLQTTRATDQPSRTQAALVKWDPDLLHVTIRKWALKSSSLTLKISPLR